MLVFPLKMKAGIWVYDIELSHSVLFAEARWASTLDAYVFNFDIDGVGRCVRERNHPNPKTTGLGRVPRPQTTFHYIDNINY